MPVINNRFPQEERGWGKKRVDTILSKRTEKLALREPQISLKKNAIQILSFSLGNKERYALPMDRISKVIRLKKWTPVPKSHELIKGVISLNSDFFCLIALINMLDMNLKSDGVLKYAMTIKHTRNCLMIEAPKEIYTIHPDDLIPPSHEKENPITRYTRGIIMDDLILLDMDKILAHPVFNHTREQRR